MTEQEKDCPPPLGGRARDDESAIQREAERAAKRKQGSGERERARENRKRESARERGKKRVNITFGMLS
eukprot:105268-Amorphochlora_amoeboformis.AAC.1